MANAGLSPGLVAELEALRKEKERLEKEVSDFQGMVKRIQSTRTKMSDTNASGSVGDLKRNTTQQNEKVAKLRDHQKALLAQKFAIEEQLKAEADKQVARREELEVLTQKVKQIFEEENEKRGLLENVKAGLEAEIKRTQRLLSEEATRRALLERSFRRDIAELKANLQKASAK